MRAALEPIGWFLLALISVATYVGIVFVVAMVAPFWGLAERMVMSLSSVFVASSVFFCSAKFFIAVKNLIVCPVPCYSKDKKGK
jgi:hypothetical protein